MCDLNSCKNYKRATSVKQLIDLIFPNAPRQVLKFLEIKMTPMEPIKANYLPRGSLTYEMGTELLQTPIQLLRISSVEAQVLCETFIFILVWNDIQNVSLGYILLHKRSFRV